MTLSAVAAAPAAGRLATRFGLRAITASGLVLVAAGLLLMARMSEGGALPFVISGMVVGEVGFTLSIVPLEIAARGGGRRPTGAGGGPPEHLHAAWERLRLAVVATVVAVVSPALGGEAASPEALVGGLRLGLLARVGFAVVALPIVVWGVPEGKSSGKRAPSRDG